MFIRTIDYLVYLNIFVYCIFLHLHGSDHEYDIRYKIGTDTSFMVYLLSLLHIQTVRYFQCSW